MRFEVLGPLRVWQGERELELGFPQQRALLGLLLVYAGRPVQLSEIVDVLWTERLPVSAAHMVRRHAGALRRLLEPGLPPRAPGRRLLRRSGGYLLEAATDEVDLLRFRELTGQGKRAAATGRPEAAERHFTDALREWRGPVAMGIPASARGHAAFTAVQRELLDTTRMAADAALLCGRAEHVLPILRRAAELEPLDESLHARLVITLAACGLQAEALTAYEDIRRHLAAELGVPPGAELAAAHTRVLRQQIRRPEPARGREEQPIGSSPPPPGLPALCGREAELDRLTRIADAAAASPGAPTTILITGMPGIGKTALARHWADRAADRFPDGQLHLDLGGFDPARPTPTRETALRALLTSLAQPPRRVPDGEAALTGLYRSLLAGRRVLVLLDDAADTEQIRPLLPASPGCLTLVTSRHALPGLVASGAHPLRLDLPSPADGREMLAQRIGAERIAAEPRGADEIIARCGRLPLAVTLVAARAAGRPDLPLSALAAELRDSHGSLDALSSLAGAADVRAAFLRSYRFLPPRGARLFRLLSLHPGPEIEVTAAAALAGMPVRGARPLLGELADAHLVIEQVPGRYALHDLLRAFATELTEEHDSPAERDAALRRLAEDERRAADRPQDEVPEAPSLPCHSFCPHADLRSGLGG